MSSAAAASATVRTRAPSTESRAKGSGRGAIDTRPRLGLRPTSPQHDAGIRIEPPPSLPLASGTILAATAAALPPDDPPDVRDGSNGLRVGPNRRGSVIGRIPNSGVFVLPTTIAPAARRRRTGSLSRAGTQSPPASVPHVVRMASGLVPR